MTDLDDLLELQAGVISRRQALRLGLAPHDLERKLRRREWVRVLPGVFLDHTGEPSWEQRAWAGVLYYWPAVLCHESALRAHGALAGKIDDGAIHVAVTRHRHVGILPGYRVRRVAHLDTGAQWHLAPPRMKVEDAAIDVAAESETEFTAFEILAEICRSRRTTPQRLGRTARSRARLRRRELLLAIVDDLAAGVGSVLERGYLVHVERRHGLPAPRRQRPTRGSGGSRYRDVDYPAYGLVVELDGRMFHDTTRGRDRDLERDLDTAVEGGTTIRLGWGQVFDRSCRTADRVGALLRALGWEGTPTPCGPGCLLETRQHGG
jgi:hypothetical protein